MGDQSQTALLEQFLAGVETRAYGMAMVATMNRADALDIVQEAMYKLAHNYASKPADQWAPLFQRILQHSISDWHRRQSRQRRWFSWWPSAANDDDEQHFDAAAPTQLQPEQQLQQQQSGDAIKQALHKLPLRQQQAFLLRQWEGLDVEQTARAMGCSSGSVKTHYSRAIQNLRQQLQELQ